MKAPGRTTRSFASAWAVLFLVSGAALAGPPSDKKPSGKPPSRNTLPAATASGPGALPISTGLLTTGGTTPLAWMDEASLLPPGTATLMTYIADWHGTNASELDAPVVDLALGLSPRLQLGANIPHVVGSEADGGAVGGLGTSYFSAKVGVITDQPVKLAVTPTIEVLGRGVLASLSLDEHRLQWGLPVVAEFDRGTGRAYAAAGYFSPGIWFAGAGVGLQATRHLGLSGSFSHSWAANDAVVTLSTPARERNELTAGASYAIASQVAVFGSIARSIATTDENGAGVTVSGGVLILTGTAARIR